MRNSYFKMIADKGFTAQIRSKRPTFDQQTRYVKPKSKGHCPFIIYSASESEDSDNVSCFICICQDLLTMHTFLLKKIINNAYFFIKK